MEERSKIRGFDGIRALAVVAVVFTHLGIYDVLASRGLLADSITPMLHGATGVQAFFVLSGFLITTLLLQEFAATGTISLRNFIIRRTLRIFPLYALFLLVATLLHVLLDGVTSWRSLSYAYLYAYNFIPSSLYTPFIGHTWSLAVEEHFYLVWPTLVLLLLPSRRWALVTLLLVFIPTAPLLHLVLVKTGSFAGHFVERWSFISGSSIAVGCFAALMVGSETTGPTVKQWGGSPAALLASFVLYGNSLWLSSNSWAMQNIVWGQLRTVGIALFITWLYVNQTGRVADMLERRPIRYIGAISYGIYMYQGLFLATGPGRRPGQAWPPQPEWGIALLLFAAPLSYRLFESPFLRLRKRFSPAR